MIRHRSLILPLRKPISVKGFPSIILLYYYQVHEEVGFYPSSFLTYLFDFEFLELVELFHVDLSNVMYVESCWENEYVFMRDFLCETHFTYMYSSFPSTLHLTVAFDKFEVDVLRELNVAPTQLHPNAQVAMCAFKVLCDLFFIILTTPKFLHHYTVKENKSGG